MNHHLHVSNLHLDCLTLDDWLTEGYTVSCTLKGDLEHTLCHTEVRASDVYTRYREGVDSYFHALALFAKQINWVKLQVGELKACMTCTLAAHHMRHRDDFETWCIVRYEECRKTRVLVAFLVGNCDNIGVVRAVGVGDEPLFTVQNVRTISLLLSGGVKVSTGTTSLLGDSKVAVNGLVLELVHELCLELRLTIVLEDTPVHVSCMMEMHTHSARSTRELFLNLQDFKLVEVPSTVF